MMGNKLKCPKCECKEYTIVSYSNNRDGILEYRQCKQCYRRYKVMVHNSGTEQLL